MSLICPTIRSLAVQNIHGCSVPSSVFCCMIAGYNDMILTSRRIVCEGTCLITCFLVLVVLYAVALQCNNIRSLYACTRQSCRVFAYLLLLLICCNRNRCVFYPTLRMCLSETPLDENNFFNLPFCPSSPERTKKRQNSVLTTHHLFCLQHFGLNIRQREDLKSQKMCQMTWRIF